MLPKGSKIYFMGIGGTGMATVAGLCREAGYEVVGSDAGVYPPMSIMLDELGIEFRMPYDPDHLISQKPDLVVVANVLSRGNPEVEYMLEKKLPHTSFPKLLHDLFLESRIPLVVSGTHGKTTTASLLAHVLYQLGEDPGFFIGGMPRNFPRSFRLGGGRIFILEGDEYDTAFFDKGPKFLHYAPQFLIVNNLEYDHADIYEDVSAIATQFAKLIDLVPQKSGVIINMDDRELAAIVQTMGIDVRSVSTLGHQQGSHTVVEDVAAQASDSGEQAWTATIRTRSFGCVKVETALSGTHNMANIAQVITCIEALQDAKVIGAVDPVKMIAALKSFKSVKRRLDHLARIRDIDIYEDFAHHPTAVRSVIDGFRQVYPNRRLKIAFEPRSAIQRRNIFLKDYADILGSADRVYIGHCPEDKRIPESERMRTDQLQAAIGEKAVRFSSNDELYEALHNELQPGDTVIFMSSGSFSGIQYRLAQALAAAGNDRRPGPQGV